MAFLAHSIELFHCAHLSTLRHKELGTALYFSSSRFSEIPLTFHSKRLYVHSPKSWRCNIVTRVTL